MKTKIYIGILQALMLTGLTANAQKEHYGAYRNDDVKVVVNNYYDNYDYYYASRINRFHRSYTHFDYYAPVFTDAYWYTYDPYSWGISIYGGNGFGFGYYEYPVYSYAVGYDPAWYNPYYGSYYYGGYDPFFYGRWYAPLISIRIGSFWPHYYFGYNGHDHHYTQHYYDYDRGYNGYGRYSNNYYNNYYYNNYYSSRGSHPDRNYGRPAGNTGTTSESNRRGTNPSGYRPADNHGNSENNINNRVNGNHSNNANNGNNVNSRVNGNKSNNTNNGNNVNSRVNGNNSNNTNNGNNVNSRVNPNRSTNVNNGNNVNSRNNGSNDNNRNNGAVRSNRSYSNTPNGSGTISNTRSRTVNSSPAKSSGSVSGRRTAPAGKDAVRTSPKSSSTPDNPDRRR